MNEHPIENLMNTAMNSIKDMIDVDKIIGEPIQASNNTVIIPISKVGFGFAAGGSEFRGETIDEYTKRDKEEQVNYRLPFGGGAGAGVSISPVAFLVVTTNSVKLLPVEHNSCFDRLIDYVPEVMEKINSMINKQMQNKKEEKDREFKAKDKEQEMKIKEYQKKENKLSKEIKEEKNKNIKNKSIDDINNEKNNDGDEFITEENIITTVKPKRSAKIRKPSIEEYDIEYDETGNYEE